MLMPLCCLGLRCSWYIIKNDDVRFTAFAAGQVLPLLLAGVAAAWVPRLLALRALGQWVPPLSGAVLLISGALTLLAQWS